MKSQGCCPYKTEHLIRIRANMVCNFYAMIPTYI